MKTQTQTPAPQAKNFHSLPRQLPKKFGDALSFYCFCFPTFPYFSYFSVLFLFFPYFFFKSSYYSYFFIQKSEQKRKKKTVYDLIKWN